MRCGAAVPVAVMRGAQLVIPWGFRPRVQDGAAAATLREAYLMIADPFPGALELDRGLNG
jgi:hypothetical protein